jgi:hypothetical protein
MQLFWARGDAEIDAPGEQSREEDKFFSGREESERLTEYFATWATLRYSFPVARGQLLGNFVSRSNSRVTTKP